MKKILIAVLMILGIVSAHAQIDEIPLSNRPNDVYLRDTNIVVGVIPSNTGQSDSFATVSTRFPTFVANDGYVTYSQIENAWNSRQFQKNEYIINGLVYKPSRTKHFALLSNRYGLALVQKVGIYEPKMAEKTDIEKVYYLYEFAIDSSYTISTLNSYQPYIDLLDKLNGVTVPIDTTVTDSIQ